MAARADGTSPRFPSPTNASSQTLLFTFSLILLFSEQYATRQRILHATPSLLFTLAYAGACLIMERPPRLCLLGMEVTGHESAFPDPHALSACLHHPVRHLCKLFLHERHTYLSLLGGVKTEDELAQTRTGDSALLPCLRHRPLYAEPRLESLPASRNHRDLPIHRFLFRLRNLLRKLQFHLSGYEPASVNRTQPFLLPPERTWKN